MVRASAAASQAGLVRPANEDAAYAGRWLFAVAEGLGGQLRQIIEDHTIRQPRLRRWLARAGARTAPGRQASPSG